MTDQPPTNPGDIWVKGQRRSGPNFAFNGRFEPGSYETPVEVVPADDLNPQPERDRCADPAERLDIDADAAAAEGLRRMQTDANDPLLDGRERSIVIARDPATGRVYSGNMLVGVLGEGTVGWDFTGIPMAHVIGLMHSHPGSGPYPSSPDQEGVFPTAFSNIQNAGGNPHLLRLYMAGTRADPGGPARLQIRVYDQTNLYGDEDNPGPEVNPDAQFCPI